MLSIKEASIVDYKKYWDQGFFITESPSVNFEYIPIGAVTVTLQDGYETIANAGTAPKKTGWASRSRSAEKQSSTKYADKSTLFTLYDAIDMAVAKAKENGADGLINLSYEINSIATSKQTTYGGTYDLGSGHRYVIKGMAVKRK